MNLRQIEAFRAVMMHGTMTAAARELHTSQPSISRLVTELEERLQFKLFVRGASRLLPTDEASAFYREVEHSFSGLENLRQAAHEIRISGTGRLRIAAIPAVASGLLPRVLRRFRERFPNVSVMLEMRSEATVRRWTSAGYCDIGYASTVEDTSSVRTEALYRLPGVAALPANHALARKQVIRPEDFHGLPFISLSSADRTRRLVDQAFDQANVARQMSLETPYGITLCALVSQGLGVSVVNPLATMDIPPGSVVFRRFEPAIHFYGFTVLPAEKAPNLLVQTFTELTRNEITNEEWARHIGY